VARHAACEELLSSPTRRSSDLAVRPVAVVRSGFESLAVVSPPKRGLPRGALLSPPAERADGDRTVSYGCVRTGPCGSWGVRGGWGTGREFRGGRMYRAMAASVFPTAPAPLRLSGTRSTFLTLSISKRVFAYGGR